MKIYLEASRKDLSKIFKEMGLTRVRRGMAIHQKSPGWAALLATVWLAVSVSKSCQTVIQANHS